MQQKSIAKWNSSAYFKSTLVIVILVSFLLLSLPFWTSSGEEVSLWLLFGGRFHPLIIHFPIVLLFLLLLWEILIKFNWIERQLTFQSLLLVLSSVFSVLSVLIGFALYQSGGYSGDTLALHLYSGIGVAIGSLAALMIFWKAHQTNSSILSHTYLTTLLITNILLVFASHQGGSLTHGQDFLSEHFPLKTETESSLAQTPVEEMLVFEDIIQSTLDARCYSCHNENKTKGDYLMTSFDHLLEGGKSDKTAIIPGDARGSELFHRITLPEDHDDHMPPEGKTSLTNQEIQIMDKWISHGAQQDMRLADIDNDSLFLALLRDKAQQLRQEMLVQERRNIELDGLIQLVAHQEQTFVLEKDPDSNTGLALSMQFPSANFDDNQLAELQAVFPHIHKASFNASNISDDALYHIGQMKDLKALFLQHTRIKGSGLIYLQNLESLEVLDLSGSEVDDAGLLNVIRINGLRHVYLYETPVSEAVVNALIKNNPDLEVHLERGSLF